MYEEFEFGNCSSTVSLVSQGESLFAMCDAIMLAVNLSALKSTYNLTLDPGQSWSAAVVSPQKFNGLSLIYAVSSIGDIFVASLVTAQSTSVAHVIEPVQSLLFTDTGLLLIVQPDRVVSQNVTNSYMTGLSFPQWDSGGGCEINAVVVQDPTTHVIYFASSGGTVPYSILGFDPTSNATSGWISDASSVYPIAEFGIHLSSGGNILVLTGSSVVGLERSSGLSELLMAFPTAVNGESVVAPSSGLVCAADLYVTQCTTSVNNGQCARCAPPDTLLADRHLPNRPVLRCADVLWR